MKRKIDAHEKTNERDGRIDIVALGFGRFVGKRVVHKYQDVGQQDIKPQEVLRVHGGGGAIHVKEHHKDAHGGTDVVPQTAVDIATGLFILLDDLLEFFLIGSCAKLGIAHGLFLGPETKGRLRPIAPVHGL